MKVKIFVLGIILLSFIFTGCFNPHTPAGHEGYVYEKTRFWGNGGFKDNMIGPKNYGMSLWKNLVINVDTRPITYKESFDVLTADDLNVKFKYHAIFKIKKNEVKTVVEQFGGKKWYSRYIQKTLRTYVRETVQSYPTGSLKQNRDFITATIKQKLNKFINGSPFILINGVVGNITPPERITIAAESKIASIQLLKEKDTQKKIAIKNAEIKIEEAIGIAEAQKIINKTLTSNYLQLEAIRAQLKMAESPNHTTVYIPSGNNGIPLIKRL